MIWIATRHAATIEWLRRRGIVGDRVVAHFDDGTLPARGDIVVGVLPVEWFARLCSLGVRCIHLAVEWPRELRGRTLTVDELETLAPHLVEVRVAIVGDVDPYSLR
ncbi:MAG TPA: CRISPR-associated protein Csx16 [Tahibacter sp.]|nr:CRISPR-associated protein Csx16 [Tahibacter sp.]